MEEHARWWRISLTSPLPDLVASRLWDAGAGGVEIQDGDTFFEGLDQALEPGQTRLIGYFELEAEPDAAALHEALAALDDVTAVEEVAELRDRSWATRWREFFKPLSLSPRLAVGPPWEEVIAPEGGAAIIIEPGMAFGTGTHETSQLCASLIDAWFLGDDRRGRAMLDVGCGTGILSMAAYHLGAGPITAIDIDADAVRIAAENWALNALPEGAASFSATPLADLEGRWPLVVANILGHILVAIAPELRARVAPGGTLLLSGLIDKDLPRIEAAYLSDALWVERERAQLGEWHALVLERIP